MFPQGQQEINISKDSSCRTPLEALEVVLMKHKKVIVIELVERR